MEGSAATSALARYDEKQSLLRQAHHTMRGSLPGPLRGGLSTASPAYIEKGHSAVRPLHSFAFAAILALAHAILRISYDFLEESISRVTGAALSRSGGWRAEY
jgi:hypothetical protein